MQISVIIPAFNAATTLGETLASVQAQTTPPFETIVVDDGSTDDTAAVAKSFGAKVIMQANAGVAIARNTGVAAATGDVLAFLDADDTWHPRKLELQTPLLERSPFVATFCYPWPGSTPQILHAPLPQPIDFRELVIRNSLITSTVMVKRDIMVSFDPRLQGPEDYDAWLRILQHHPGVELPLPLAGYRTVLGSLSKNAARMEAGMAIILQKLKDAGVLHGKLQRQSRGYFHYSCAYMHHAAGHRSQARSHILRSLAQWPWFYPRRHVRYSFGRLRLLLKTLGSA